MEDKINEPGVKGGGHTVKSLRNKTAQIRLERWGTCPLDNSGISKVRCSYKASFELHEIFIKSLQNVLLRSIITEVFKHINSLREADLPQNQTLTIQAFITQLSIFKTMH